MKQRRSKGKHKVNIVLTLLLAVCLFVSGTASMLPKSYAAATIAVYQVGDDVTATLYSNGCLSLSGSGETYDYNPGVTVAPFYGSRQSITSLEIGGQITEIGDYLFYNCGNLTGTLTIPASVVRIGTRAFSGDSAVNAPSFKYIYNKFIEGDIVVEPETDGMPEANAGPLKSAGPVAFFQPVQMQANGRIIVADGEPDGVPTDSVPEAPITNDTAPVSEAPPANTTPPQAPVSDTPPADTAPPQAPVSDTLPADTTPPQAPVSDTPPADTTSPQPPVSDTTPPATTANTTDTKDTTDTKADPPATESPQNHETESKAPVSGGNGHESEKDTKQTDASINDTTESSTENTVSGSETAESGNETTESGSETAESESDTDMSETEESESVPETEIRHITQQEIGGEIFYPGQTGVYHADGMQNTGFINAAAAAGYRRIDGWTQLTFNNGAGQSNTISVPVASGSVFLPDYPAAGLPIPEDAYSTYEFRGWADGTADESGLTASESCTPPWNFTGSSVTSVTAAWQKSLRNMEEQTISANVAAPDGTHMLGVSITGNLPAGSGVSAEMIPVSDAQALVDSQLGEDNGSTVLYALDISILVDGEKYQPSDYGESVQVSITDIPAADSQPLQVWHVAEDENGNAAGLEDVAVESVAADALAFNTDSFSTYIVTLKATGSSYKVNIAASDRYKLYSDAQCTQILEPEITVENNNTLDFWLQAETYGENPDQYYEITAYMAGADGQAVILEPVAGTQNAENAGTDSAETENAETKNTENQNTETPNIENGNTENGGRYHYQLTVASDTSIWFTSNEAGPDPQDGGPRAELDLQDGSVTVEASGSGFIVTYGTQSWTWSGGNTFYITSAGVQTGNTFTLKSGIINVYMDSLNINSIGSAINVLGGTLNLYVANGMGVAASAAGGNADNGNAGSGASDSGAPGGESAGSGTSDGGNTGSGAPDSGTGTLSTMTSTSAPAIGVRAGASLFLTADAGQTLHLNSGASPAIGGTGDNSAGNIGAGNNISGNGSASDAGNVQITNNGADLVLNAGGGATAQIVAKQYTYITNANTGALPFTAALSESRLAGYFTNGRLYAADADQTVTATTSFQSCGVSYDLGQLTVSESVTAEGGLEISAAVNENDKNMPMKVSVTREGALTDGTHYSWVPAEGRLTVIPQEAYGNLHIARNGDACYLRGIIAANVTAGSGRVLNQLSASGASTDTAANGAATLHYDMQYVPDAGHSLRLDFSQPLPSGTELTFIDFTSGGAPAYYYYHASGAVKTVPLTDFFRMGTTLVFAEPTAAEEGTAVTVKYQICVDFPEESGDTSSLNVTLSQGNGADGLAAGSGLAAGDTSSKTSGAQTAATETVSDGTSGDASGNVSLADAPINLTASINRLGTVGASGNVTIGAVTTKGSNMNVPLTVSASGPGNAVLILRLLDAEDKPAVFPEKTACAEASTAKTIRGNLAIFDLGTAQMSGSEYNVSIPDLSAGSYKVQADICVVPSEEYASPMHGWVGSSDISGAAEISGPEIYGITAELARNGDDRIVSNDTGNRLTFNVTYTAPEDSQAHVDISVESKTTGGFYGLDRPDWTVGGPDISETEGGSSMVQYTVSIPAGTPKGTYRINFTLNYTDSSGKPASVTHPYNIIVQ